MNILFDPVVYKHRREELARIVYSGLVILPNATPKTRSFDTTYPYRWDSSFYYLCGFWEEDSALVMRIAEGHCVETMIFCHPSDPQKELWEGKVTGLEAVCPLLGVDSAYDHAQLMTVLSNRQLLLGKIWFSLGEHPDLDRALVEHCRRVRRKMRAGSQGLSAIADIKPVIDDLRLRKSAEEIAVMRQAAHISVEAHEAAARLIHPGLHEYEVEASFIQTFRSHNARHAYNPIIASGGHACTLHYNMNDAELRAGELLLIDAACELQGYACDITRTYPISGTYTPAQARLYDAVLDAQQEAIAALRVGESIALFHQRAIEVLVEHLCQLGLLIGSREEIMETRAYEAFYMHGTGHWIGLDVHDPGPYPTGQAIEAYQAGMVITVEPGLYIRPSPSVPEAYWHIGIRTEDVVLITEHGPDVLTKDLAKSRSAIESLMRGPSGQ